MKALFEGKGFAGVPYQPENLGSTLEVYRACEDFLALGPVAQAGIAMVLADIRHSAEEHGIFCCIFDMDGRQTGIIDFIPGYDGQTAFLLLLMIARQHRYTGLGTEVLQALEKYLQGRYGTTRIESGVQVNNPAAIAFWKKNGFIIGTEARHLDDGTTAYEMVKTL
ncbi:MAG: GNAT family N-acetyltransferase [Spirochaetales bacterium]|nr:GNAT family N-acetyltransferase [Spirochaetales bacterium]